LLLKNGKARRKLDMTIRTPRFSSDWAKRILALMPFIVLIWLVGFSQQSWALSRGTLVMFHANWCASCRQVLPVIKEIATQNNMTFLEIDVDSQDAPKQARNVGLSIPGDEPPQIYSLSRGRTTLIYNGKTFRSGSDADSIRAIILQNLQQVLP
jgi:thiol-disulfide isomerase/thioredoxin